MSVTLRKRLEKVIRDGHPWIFRDALVDRLPEPGRVVTVLDAKGRFVARGLAEAGPIGLRVFCTRDQPLDNGLFVRRIQAAAELRRRVVPPETTAFRLLHGEGDRLPGVVCDIYGKYAVLQLDGQAVQKWVPTIVEALKSVFCDLGVTHLLHRIGRREARRVEALQGSIPNKPIMVLEHGMRQKVDLVKGQKTGLFLDHRESRRRVRALSGGLRVLNLYGYTGGFSLAAGLGGAIFVKTVDQSASACALAEENWAENGLDPALHSCYPTSVQAFLESKQERDQLYGLIVADPPSFAPNQSKLQDALQAYRALHRSAFCRIESGGLYLAASCSSHVRREIFEESVLEAARKIGRALQVLERWGAPADHPRLAAFPEGDYLKVLLVRLVD